MEYLIRDFQADDIGKLVSLCNKHAVYEHVKYVSEGKDVLLKSVLLSPTPPLHCWIVTVKDEIVGYATFTFDFSTWDVMYFLHLDCLYVDENFRGYGIGAEIIRRLCEIAKKKGCANMQWQTPLFNEKAIRFYERLCAKGLEKKRFSIIIEH